MESGDGAAEANPAAEDAVSSISSALTCPAPALTPVDASSLTAARNTFNAGARSGYTWCRIGTLTRYSEPVCPASPISLETVVNQITEVDGDLRGWSFADGTVLTSTQIAAIEPFTTTCSPGGPAFATAVRTKVSSAPRQGWLIESEVPCHNCHEFGRFYVLWYPSEGKVLVIPYITGYDS